MTRRQVEALEAMVLLAASAVLGGCSERTIDVASDPKPLCGTANPPGPLHLVANNVVDASLGACGQLAYIDDLGALWLTATELGDPTQLAVKADAVRFAATGDLLGFTTPTGAAEGATFHVRALDTLLGFQVPLFDRTTFGLGHAGETARAFVCDQGGLRVFDPTSGNSPIYQAPDADCQSVIASTSGSRLVYSTRSDRLESVGLEKLDTQAIGGLTWRTKVASPRDAQDQLALSHDGAVLLHRRQITEPCGDTFCGVDATVSLVDLSHGAQLLGTQRGGTTGSFDFLQADRNGHAILFADWFLDQSFHLRSVDGQPQYLFRDESTALVRQPDAITKLALADQKVLQTVDHGASVAVSADESAVAIGGATADCIHFPDRPDTCHDQIWAVTSWKAAPQHAAIESTQPVTPLWVGADGAMLVRGALPDQPLPRVAAPADVPGIHGAMHLFDAQGHVLHTWDAGEADAVWEANQTLLLRYRINLNGAWRTRLEAVNVATGNVQTLAEDDIVEVSLDHSHTRLVFIARHFAPNSTLTALWAGAVPQP